MSNDLVQARNGLGGRVQVPKRIVIVGSGMAGLVTGEQLMDAGHEVVVVEARHRVGGRIETIRDPFTPGLYGEAGAMRIPHAHHLTMAYVERFGLDVIPFTLANPNGYRYFHERRHRAHEVDADPALLGFGLAEHEGSVVQMWESSIDHIKRLLEAEGESAWPSIIEQYDPFSTREYLEWSGWSEGAIERFGLLENQEAVMNSSFLEVLREEIGNCYRDLVQIRGGMDLLPNSFLAKLGPHIRFGAKMVALEQSPDGVTIHYRTRAGRAKESGDFAVLTIPFPVLRHIEVSPPFSPHKVKAIRQLHYDASSKIFLQFRRRFWEEDEAIEGGATITDLPIRNVFYPEHGQETGRGVVLASYTWSEDAQRWGSLSPEDRIDQSLENLALIHPQAPAEFEVGASKMWHDDEFAGGAFALFDPGQQTLLHEAIAAPEGRVHFAGEHTSLAHAWIQGAIESGLRVAREVHEAARHTAGGAPPDERNGRARVAPGG